MCIALGMSAGVASYRSDTFAAERARNSKERRRLAVRETNAACSSGYDGTQSTGPRVGLSTHLLSPALVYLSVELFAAVTSVVNLPADLT
jgi:hypothetical protein